TMRMLALFLLASPAFFAQSPALEELIDAARQGPGAPGLQERITKTLGAHGGVAVWGQDYLFVADSPAPPTVAIDREPPAEMGRIANSNLWMLLRKMRTGVTHEYQFYAAGKPLGARGDAVGYNSDSYPKPGVPRGKLSEKHTIASKIYDGMKADYWVYASPGVDPEVPAPLMVWQDGQGLVGENSRQRLFTVTENLVHQKLLPPVVYVMIAPGASPEGRAMRSIEYDTVTDRYARFLMEEVLPEVERMYKLRQDGYSRAIGGESSGGICAFNVAWLMPDKFSRVHSAVGSFTSIQWRPQENLDGGNVYPFKVRKEPKRNIRVWMSDGSDDLENNFGSWPMQNIQMANSLKLREYDFHFRFGTAAHGSAQASLDLPESLAWLWRGYDPMLTSQEYKMDPAEKEKPFFRVTIANRDAW
ncbi:MAG TPA: alpha/beta hydrolase-fold protein, partial [Candidatus Sulfopaludibacter sp.]|nr:alpha/beta hydrolase-fold protein [Candidatus Sulfopaludibacter sp.]